MSECIYIYFIRLLLSVCVSFCLLLSCVLRLSGLLQRFFPRSLSMCVSGSFSVDVVDVVVVVVGTQQQHLLHVAFVCLPKWSEEWRGERKDFCRPAPRPICTRWFVWSRLASSCSTWLKRPCQPLLFLPTVDQRRFDPIVVRNLDEPSPMDEYIRNRAPINRMK